MSRKKPERRSCPEPTAPKLPIADQAPQLATALPQPLRMRLGAGRHAVKAAEVEIHIEGIRLTGGYGIVEFDLHTEARIDIVVIVERSGPRLNSWQDQPLQVQPTGLA